MINPGRLWLCIACLISTEPGAVRAQGTLEGYCWPLSAAPGSSINFCLSGQGSTSVYFYRHKANASGLTSIPLGSTNVVTSLQVITDTSARDGCGWTNSFTLLIPSNWVSGMYSARCTNSAAQTFWITFVVKPNPGQRGRIAALANINTWNAYNSWGGGSKYDGRAHLSLLRPNSEVSPVSGALHLARAELWMLGWFEDHGYTPDLYTDLDFHNGVGLQDYKCLVIHTHPEYWSLQMYANLKNWLNAGGCVIYLGGNGIYEDSEYTPDQTGMIFLAGVENGPRDAAMFRNMYPPMSERMLLGEGCEIDIYALWAGFQALQASHPFFQGTGLVNGNAFGQSGLNGGGASGWEVDTIGPGSPANTIVLARGLNYTDGLQGGDMTYYAHPAGGFVFGTGSISFGGSLVVDPALQQIVSNALNEALADPPQLKLASISGGWAQLKIRGRPSMHYLIQQSTDLNSTNWEDIALLLGDGTTQTVLTPCPANAAFYRSVPKP